MRTRIRLFGAMLIAGATALAISGVGGMGGTASAQSRKSASKPAKPPASAKVDAAAPAPEASSQTESTATADAAAPAASATTDIPTQAPETTGDGGVRPSPLNPTAQEMPGNVDGGAAPPDYDRLLADIAALRARVAAVSDNLYQSRVAIALQTDGDHGKIARLSVSLDDGVVYTAPPTFVANDLTTVYDHAVAPGRHAITVDVDRKDDRDEAFRTSQRNRFTVDVPRDHRLEVQVKVIDDSNMGKDFPADKNGRYDLRFRVRAVAKPVGK